MGVYTRFTPSSGFGVAGSSLVVSLGSGSLPEHCRQGIIVSLPCILLHAEIIDRPSY